MKKTIIEYKYLTIRIYLRRLNSNYIAKLIVTRKDTGEIYAEEEIKFDISVEEPNLNSFASRYEHEKPGDWHLRKYAELVMEFGEYREEKNSLLNEIAKYIDDNKTISNTFESFNRLEVNIIKIVKKINMLSDIELKKLFEVKHEDFNELSIEEYDKYLLKKELYSMIINPTEAVQNFYTELCKYLTEYSLWVTK